MNHNEQDVIAKMKRQIKSREKWPSVKCASHCEVLRGEGGGEVPTLNRAVKEAFNNGHKMSFINEVSSDP